MTGQLGAQYADMTHGVFVSTAAAGVMREFGWRTKSLSMATFNAEEVKKLKQGGNAAAELRYLSGWNQQSYPRPPARNERQIRQWVQVRQGKLECMHRRDIPIILTSLAH